MEEIREEKGRFRSISWRTLLHINLVELSNVVLVLPGFKKRLLTIKDGKTRFHFSETMIGRSITIMMNEYTRHALKYLVSFYTNPISLNDILTAAGATIVSGPDERDDCDIDLSPEILDKGSFLSLLRPPATGE